jgi:SAM-dependent methyltransferase
MAQPPVTADIQSFQAHAAWLHACENDAARYAGQDHETAVLHRDLTAAGMRGFCVICDAEHWYRCPELGRGQAVSLRESLCCERCGGNARQRAAARILIDSVSLPQSRVYLTEQASRFYLHLGDRARQLLGSEFIDSWPQRLRLSFWLLRQGHLRWLRRQDVTQLSFRDRSFDAVVSLDVLEHVPDFRRALAEFARVLRPEGVLVLSVPFYVEAGRSRELARIVDGVVEHLQPPEFHGDPVSGGVLCFHHFGWDLLDALREAGFTSAEAVRVRDTAQGLPAAQWILRARR